MKIVISYGKMVQTVWLWERHKHDYWELLYFLTGDGTVTIEGMDAPVPFNEGTIMLIPPQVYHWEASETGYQTMFFGVSQFDFSEEVHVFHDFPHKPILTMLELIPQAYSFLTWNTFEWIDCMLDALQHALYAQQTDMNPYVQSAIRLISANITNPDFNIGSIYNDTFMSKDHFRRLFVKYTSENPTNYLINKRIDYACKLLAYTKNVSVKIVANACGFSDPLQFSKTFKKRMGISPTEYCRKIASKSTK